MRIPSSPHVMRILPPPYRTIETQAKYPGKSVKNRKDSDEKTNKTVEEPERYATAFHRGERGSPSSELLHWLHGGRTGVPQSGRNCSQLAEAAFDCARGRGGGR